MANEVDNRVVQMQFDNARFEQNIRTSMNSLDTLNTKLNYVGANKGLDELSTKSKSFDLTSISDGVESLTKRFSTMGIVGMAAIQNITNSALNLGKKIGSTVFNLIKQGGINRALNIEQAKFQIKGLGYEWEDLEKQINYGVKDTAYGLDAAAKVASQLLASNVEFSKSFDPISNSDQMSRALRGISGVAAMTNSTYEDIGRVFTTVAGNGRLMGEQLLQLSSRGLNVAATLGKYLNKSEEDVRKMVTEGKIDFATFADAMDDAFGQHAKDANKTFSGSLSNVKAALSRLGAKFATPGLEHLRDIFNDLIPVIDNASKSLDPFVDKTKNAMSFVSGIAESILKYIKIKQDVSLSNTNLNDDSITENKELDAAINQLNEFANKLLIDSDNAELFRKGVDNLIEGLGQLKERVKNLLFNTPSVDKYRIIINNIYSSIANVIIIIKNLFNSIKPLHKEVFDFLYNLKNLAISVSEGIQTITEKIKEFFSSKERLDNIHDAFRGLRSIISIVKNIFYQLVEAIKPSDDVISRFSGNIVGVVDVILDFVGKVGRFITYIDEVVRKSSTIGNTIGKIKDVISKMFSGFSTENIEKTIDSVKSVASPLKAVSEIITHILSAIGTALKELVPFVLSCIDSVKEGIKNLIESAKEALGKSNAKEAIDIVNGGLFGMLLYQSRYLVNALTGFMKQFRDQGQLVLGELKDTLIGIQKGIKAEIVWKIAKSVMLLAVSCLILSGIDGENLAKSLGAITAAIGELVAAMAIVSKYSRVNTNLLSPLSQIAEVLKMHAIGNIILKMAIAVLILAVALKDLSELEPKQLAIGLMGITSLLGLVVGYAALMKKINLGETVIPNLIGISISIMILAEVVKIIGKLQPEQALQGVVAIGALLLLLAGFLERVSIKDYSKVVASLIGISVAITILGGVVKKIGKLQPEQALQGVVAIAAILGIICVFLDKVSIKDYSKVVVSLIGISVAITILGGVVKKIGKLQPEQALQGVVAIAAILGIICVFLDKVSIKDYSKVVVSLIGISVAITILGGVVKKIGKLQPEQALQGVVAIGALLVLIAGFMKFIETIKIDFKKIAGLAILTFSLISLAAAVKLIGSMPTDQVIQGLVALGIGLYGLLLAGQAASSFGPGLLMLAGAVALIGVGCLAAGVGVMAFSAGLSMLITVVAGGIGVLTAGILALIALIPPFLASLAVGLVGFISEFLSALVETGDSILISLVQIFLNLFTVFADYFPEFIEQGTRLVLGILIGIGNHMTEVTEAGLDIIINFLNGVAEKADDLVEAGLNVIISFLEGLSERIDDLIVAGAGLIISILEGISEGQQDIIDAGWNLIIDFINGLAESIEKNMPRLKAAVKRLGQAIVDQVLQPLVGLPGKMLENGKNAVRGFLNGLKDKFLGNEVSEAGSTLGKNVNKALKNTEEISSPSKVMMKFGQFVGQGFIIGIESCYRAVEKAGSGLGSYVNDSLSNAVSKAADIVSTDMNLSPTITPVLDLSSVQSGASAINGLISGQAIGISSNLGAVASMMAQRQSNNSDVVGAVNKLRRSIEDSPKNTYNFGNMTYSDNSELESALNTIIGYAMVERRV